MSLPKDLYPLTKDVPITSEWLFGHDINVMVNKIKAQQKVFTEDKTYIKPEETSDRQAYFPKQNSKNREISENPRIAIQEIQRKTDDCVLLRTLGKNISHPVIYTVNSDTPVISYLI